MGKESNRRAKRREELAKYQGDYIIPVMGPTGAGKSTFINNLLGTQAVVVGHELNSCTADVTPIKVPLKIVEQHIPGWTQVNQVVIVDTPGFDDTCQEDSEILKRIAEWLADSYGAGAKLAGVIYLHDICQRRVTGATKRNFDVFDRLCGREACSSVVLATTQWSRVHVDDIRLAEARAKELGDKFWNAMITKGSRMGQVKDQGSAWKLIEMVLCRDMIDDRRDKIWIQQEMLVLGRTLPQTEAAAVLRQRIEELIKSLKSGGASKADVREIARQVEELKEPSLGGWLKKMFRL